MPVWKTTPLSTPKQMEQARALETLVFGGKTKTSSVYRTFGIYSGDTLIALTRVNTQPLEVWKKDSNYQQIKKLDPEILISATAVHPDYRGKGAAAALRAYLQRKFSRIMTGTGARSNKAAMHHLNEKTGFRRVLERGQTTIWYWSRSSKKIKYRGALYIEAKSLIKIRTGKSRIHGTGLFTVQDLAKGQTVWVHKPGFDLVFSYDRIKKAPRKVQEYMDWFAYNDGKKFYLDSDSFKYINHSETPNLHSKSKLGPVVALRDIKAGEELTCDYREFDKSSRDGKENYVE